MHKILIFSLLALSAFVVMYFMYNFLVMVYVNMQPAEACYVDPGFYRGELKCPRNLFISAEVDIIMYIVLAIFSGLIAQSFTKRIIEYKK